MNKIIGYIIAVIGLAIAVLSFNLTKWGIKLPAVIKPAYVMIVGIGILFLGIVLSMSKNKEKVKHATEEVPIYQGKKIVGYRKQDD